jgi:hypothetical protein
VWKLNLRKEAVLPRLELEADSLRVQVAVVWLAQQHPLQRPLEELFE